MMSYPKPDGYVGTGADGTIVNQGSGGRLGVNDELNEGEFDAMGTDRCNPQGLDAFSSTGEVEPLQ